MDDDNECLQKIGISKVYKTLVQFECLQMPSRDLYQEFQFYVLSHNEMMLNRYPLPDNLDLNSRWHRSCQGLILRVCNRCNQAFYVDDTNLQYLSVSPCFYHSSKTNGLHYQCCDGDLSSQGCMSYYCHVTSDPILDNALFRETRDKRQVRMDCDLAVYGLDCEMCITTAGLQVTKIGVVNIEGLTVYETFVLPDQPIVDYVTEYSGVTANDLKGVTTTLKDVQEILLKLLNKNTILVGHGLNNDLKMLRIMHNKVVDTSVVFPRPDGRKRKLKELVKEFLHESIQGSSDGHDCIEDARACVALMLWKIGVDLKSRSSYCRDENLNGFLQNQAYPITGYHYTPPDYDSSDPYYFFRQC